MAEKIEWATRGSITFQFPDGVDPDKVLPHFFLGEGITIKMFMDFVLGLAFFVDGEKKAYSDTPVFNNFRQAQVVTVTDDKTNQYT